MSTPLAPAAWSLAPGELVALGMKASSHLGHPDLDSWWDAKTPDERDDVILAGRAALIARRPGEQFSAALRVRREAVRVLLVEIADGTFIAAHVGAAGLVVLEQVDDDRTVTLQLLQADAAAAGLAQAIAAGFGCLLTLVVIEASGGWRTTVAPGAGGLWNWVSQDVALEVEPGDLSGALFDLFG